MTKKAPCSIELRTGRSVYLSQDDDGVFLLYFWSQGDWRYLRLSKEEAQLLGRALGAMTEKDI
jgi:hypothetical protein